MTKEMFMSWPLNLLWVTPCILVASIIAGAVVAQFFPEEEDDLS